MQNGNPFLDKVADAAALLNQVQSLVNAGKLELAKESFADGCAALDYAKMQLSAAGPNIAWKHANEG